MDLSESSFHLDVTEDVRLREMEYGSENAQTLEEKKITKEKIKNEGGPFFHRYIGGESYADVFNRCATLYNEILSDWAENQYEDKIVILVCHAHTMSAWDILLMKKDICKVDWKMENCAIRIYQKQRGVEFRRADL